MAEARRARWSAAATGIMMLAAAGCSATPGAGSPSTEERTRVLQPGRPGEPARTLSPGATVRAPRWNPADVRFVQMMIRHHAQALRMCGLARTRAEDQQVSALARRISGAQGPEILAMSAWLEQHGIDDHAHGGHGTPAAASMPGMLPPPQMRRLADTSGPRFDRLFLAGMIRHHQGAVAMAGRVLTHGSDIRVAEMAADVSVEQKAEIDRLRAVRRHL